jgi:DnaK suppressor protein
MTAETAPMTAAARRAFRMLLEQHRARYLQQHELARAETVAAVPDAVAVRRSVGLLRTVEEIDAALDRIAAGTYGTCLHCGLAIAEERLEHRPFAAACVACQQTAG